MQHDQQKTGMFELQKQQLEDMDEHKKTLEGEFENLMHGFDEEMTQLKKKHQQELKTKVCYE